MRSRMPKNVQLIKEDANDEYWGPDHYHYIHTRCMLGSFEDFKSILRRCFKYLAPGAYMESQELFPTIYCDDGTIDKENPFYKWSIYQDQGMMAIRRPIRVANKLKRWYEAVGFVDVQEEVFYMPINPWPRDPRLKMLGRLWGKQLVDGMGAFSLRIFKEAFGWEQGRTESFLVDVKKAIQNTSYHGYHKV